MFIPPLLAALLTLAARAQPPAKPLSVLLIDASTAPAAAALDAFEQASAPSPWGPAARASILTGQPPEVHGLYTPEGRLPESVLTLAEKLRDAGFDAAAFVEAGAWPPAWGLERGFAVFEAGASTSTIAGWLQGRAGRRFFLYVQRPAEDGLLEQLRALGRWDDTLVLVTAVPGEAGRSGLYESALRVPLLVRHPSLAKPAGRRIPALVQLGDLVPTALEAAGVPAGGMELSGRSLLPLLKNPSARWRETVFASAQSGPGAGLVLDQRSARTRRWKLHWVLQKGAFELYDLSEDPDERRDIARQRPDVVKKLSLEMLRNLELSRPHAPGAPEPFPD